MRLSKWEFSGSRDSLVSSKHPARKCKYKWKEKETSYAIEHRSFYKKKIFGLILQINLRPRARGPSGWCRAVTVFLHRRYTMIYESMPGEMLPPLDRGGIRVSGVVKLINTELADSRYTRGPRYVKRSISLFLSPSFFSFSLGLPKWSLDGAACITADSSPRKTT